MRVGLNPDQHCRRSSDPPEIWIHVGEQKKDELNKKTNPQINTKLRMTNNKHQNVDRGTPKAGKTRSKRNTNQALDSYRYKNKKTKTEENFRWGSKKEERSLNDKWKSEVGVTAG